MSLVKWLHACPISSFTTYATPVRVCVYTSKCTAQRHLWYFCTLHRMHIESPTNATPGSSSWFPFRHELIASSCLVIGSRAPILSSWSSQEGSQRGSVVYSTLVCLSALTGRGRSETLWWMKHTQGKVEFLPRRGRNAVFGFFSFIYN